MDNALRMKLQGGMFALLILLDQWSKHWVEGDIFRPFVIIDNWLYIVRAHNDGVAFSMFDDLPDSWRAAFLIGMTLIIAAFVSYWWWKDRHQSGPATWLLTAVLAGAAGNIWDRIQYGYVVDFIDVKIHIGSFFYDYPVFNVADICISVSIVLLLILSFRKES